MFIVYLSPHVTMQNRTFFYIIMCHSHSHDVIPIPIRISSIKLFLFPWDSYGKPILMGLRESHSHGIFMGIPFP